MKELFNKLKNIDDEANNIIMNAKIEADSSIHRLKEEADSEIAAIRKTTELLEREKRKENAIKINQLRMETERQLADRLKQLDQVVQKNWTKTLDAGLKLMEKIK